MSDVPPVEPIRSTIVGVELVTIPVWHYAELLERQRAWRASDCSGRLRRMHPAMSAVDPRSRLFADPEVAIFLYEACGRTKLQDAPTLCRERFGSERAPSRATIGRYWARVRAAQ